MMKKTIQNIFKTGGGLRFFKLLTLNDQCHKKWDADNWNHRVVLDSPLNGIVFLHGGSSLQIFIRWLLTNDVSVYIRLLLIPIFFQSVASAQSAGERAETGVKQIKSLQIGDTIPKALWDIPLHVVNHPDGKDTIRLSDYQDKKLIILDFWATWCGSCYEGMDSLSRWHIDMPDIAAIAISSENVSKVEKRVHDRKWAHAHIVEPNILHDYFAYRLLPHQVILQGNRVRAISSGHNVDRNILTALAKGDSVDMYMKEDNLLYTLDLPLHAVYKDKWSDPSLQYSFALHGYIQGLGGRVGFTTLAEHRKLTVTNKRLMDVYHLLVPQRVVFRDIPIQNLNFDLHASSAEKERWRRQYAVSLELIRPSVVSREEMKAEAIDQVNRSYGYEALLDSVKMTCYLIIEDPDTLASIKSKVKDGYKLDLFVGSLNAGLTSNTQLSNPVLYKIDDAVDVERRIASNPKMNSYDLKELALFLKDNGLKIVCTEHTELCYLVKGGKGGKNHAK